MKNEENNAQENKKQRKLNLFKGGRNKKNADSDNNQIIEINKAYVSKDTIKISIFSVSILIIVLTFVFAIVYMYNYFEEEDGQRAGRSHFFWTRDEMITLYKGNFITYEELKNYAENHYNLIKLVQNNSKISQEDIKNYNNSIKEIPLIDYDAYELKANKSFVNGFRYGLEQNLYGQIITYYHDLNIISDETYNVFQTYNPEDVKEFYRDIIEKNIGNPNEIISQTDWQEYKSAEDFLKKISAPK